MVGDGTGVLAARGSHADFRRTITEDPFSLEGAPQLMSSRNTDPLQTLTFYWSQKLSAVSALDSPSKTQGRLVKSTANTRFRVEPNSHLKHVRHNPSFSLTQTRLRLLIQTQNRPANTRHLSSLI